jgi:hypothetical protein
MKYMTFERWLHLDNFYAIPYHRIRPAFTCEVNKESQVRVNAAGDGSRVSMSFAYGEGLKVVVY